MPNDLNQSEKDKPEQKKLSGDKSSVIEALLFVSPSPVSVHQLSAILDVGLRDVENALNNLKETLQGRGIRLQRHKNLVSLISAPEYAPAIEKYMAIESTNRLSRAALEALAIIAYKQPVTRPQVDAIRGVNSDGVIKNLLGKGIIEEVGRADSPGRPILYATAADFLQYFGLSSLNDLPPLDTQE